MTSSFPSIFPYPLIFLIILITNEGGLLIINMKMINLNLFLDRTCFLDALEPSR